MPNATTHILFALISADVIRDYIAKKRFSLFFVLTAGIAGVLPDLDVGIYWLLNIFRDVPLSMVHRLFTHTIFVPLLFLLVAFLFKAKKKVFLFFLMVSFGIFTHLLLDATLSGMIMPVYPLSSFSIGLNLIPGGEMGRTIILELDGVLLVGWLVHEYMKHNIRDFI